MSKGEPVQRSGRNVATRSDLLRSFWHYPNLRSYLAGHCVSLVGTGWVQRVPRDRLVLGITDNGTAHVHDLRHTYASSARRAGADLRLLQKMMGRASITATAHSYADELVRAPKLPAELQ